MARKSSWTPSPGGLPHFIGIHLRPVFPFAPPPPAPVEPANWGSIPTERLVLHCSILRWILPASGQSNIQEDRTNDSKSRLTTHQYGIGCLTIRTADSRLGCSAASQ